jgi:hypothetical protein
MKKADLLAALDTFEELVDDTYESSELEEDEECQEWVDRHIEAIEFLRKILGK